MMAWQDLRQPVVMSWSGGKDAPCWRCAACARRVPIHALIAMCEPGCRAEVPGCPRADAGAGGCPVPAAVAGGRAFQWLPRRMAGALSQAQGAGVAHVAFGDIDLQAHRDWQEQVLGGMGLNAHFLVGRGASDLGRELLSRGIRARVVALDAKRLPEAFLAKSTTRPRGRLA